MTTKRGAAQGPALTIGDLARRTGLTTATLRTWETRHGFPHPTRLESGHRRYYEADVALVEEVLRRRDAGVRLEVAVADVAAGAGRTAPSVYATLRRGHPDLHPQLLHKSTLVALSRAIEDECCARADRPVLYGGFQQARFFRQSMPRWNELARTAAGTTVFAGLDTRLRDPAVRMVHLPEDAAMRREWVLVCDAPDLPACLTAWELPGQVRVRDADRMFEVVWTLEPAAVRDAARTCADLADALDPEGAPAPPVEPTRPEASSDLRRAAGLFARVVGYVDRAQRGSSAP
jgi:DICT domain-containing protein